jgi:2-polyprenyl-3-methyl-5-hydroxy-6-metoxy-1,4-benzoquinol methylase
MPVYTSRRGRQEFLLRQCRDFIYNVKVLDVGCGEAYLRSHIKDYVGIDIAGNPDIYFDLEQEVLPFGDNSFDVVICLDALEHIQSAHKILKEIFRVSKSHVVISLPNEYTLYFRLRFLLGKPKKELGWFPRNQHKWFGSYNQAREFVDFHAKKCDFVILKDFPVFQYRRLNKLMFILERFPNFLASTYWAILRRTSQPFGG